MIRAATSLVQAIYGKERVSDTKSSCFIMTVLLLLIIFVLSRDVSAQCINSTNCRCDDSEVLCCLLVTENEPPNTVVGRPDSQVGEGLLYALNSENGIFTMNRTTSIITTLVPIDREGDYSEARMITRGRSLMDNKYCFRLGFQVTAGGTGSIFEVNIQVVDVNDNRPTFSQPSYSISIDESLDENDIVPKMCDQQTRIMLSATDKDEGDNAKIVYSVEGSSLFRLAIESIPCVQTKPGVELDRDTPPSSYSFSLVAQDATNTTNRSETVVTYILLDINDNQPMFENSSETLYIKEDLEPGAFIHQFQAHDMDSGTNGESSLTYKFERTKGNGKFTIDENSGTLSLAHKVDAEAMSSPYTMVVFANDMGSTPLTGTVQVTIYVEDVNEPTEYIITREFGIVEGTNEVNIFFFELTDNDVDQKNRVNQLSVTSDRDMFTLEHINFMIMHRDIFKLKFNGSVDYEQDQYIPLLLNLMEGGSPVLHQIIHYNVSILDVNDNAPSLNVTHFSTLEENALIISLGQYTYDLDSGLNAVIRKYRLVSVFSQSAQDLTNTFMGLLTESGFLDASKYTIDREVLGNRLTFEVNITDSGDPPQSKLNTFVVDIADINDNSPVFQLPNFEFNIREGEESGTVVGHVSASDPDNGENGTVRFAIDLPSPYFSINEATGVISSKQVFDREKDVSGYSITVKATDRGTPHTPSRSVLVTILITDVNDNSPVFDSDTKTFRIDTNFRPGKVIGQVVALDADISSFNKLTWYQIQKQPFSSMFSIRNNVSGSITLETHLSEEGNYTLNISAFNPGNEEIGDSIVVIFMVSSPAANMTLIGIIAGCTVLAIMIIITGLLVLCICLKNRNSKQQFNINEDSLKLNNMQNSILKIPAANGSVGRSGHVTFKERVEETHYDEESIINSTKKTIKKESVTKFDNSPRVPHSFINSDSAMPSPTSSSLLSNSHPGQSDDIIVVDLEISPRQEMNGAINGHCQYDGQSNPNSPIIHPSSRECGGEMMEYSQGTSSDGHTSNNDLDDEESMYSDDASIVNTALSRFGNNRSDLAMPYETPSTHSHLELHRHLPHISHGQHMHSSSLAQLHAHNQAQLAKPNTNGGVMPQYGSVLSSEHEHSLNHAPTHDLLQHQTISKQSFSHSPPGAIDHMAVSSSSKHLHMGIGGGGRNFPPPLVMPDAFPMDATDVHRFPIDAYTDYGEASTYASIELDEALGFNLEVEPGIISLTADYEDTEL